MAVVQNPLIGHGSGSTGNITFSTWKGQNVIKNRVPAKNGSNTPAQQAQRNRFRAVGLLGKKLSWISKILFGPAAAGNPITQQNLFIKVNEFNGAYVRGTTFPYNPTIDPSKVQTSVGDLVGVDSGVATPAAGRIVNFTWVDNTNGSNPLAAATDQFFAVVICDEYFNPDYGSTTEPFALLAEVTFDRSAAAGTLTLPANYLGKDVEVYLCFGQWTTTAPLGVLDHVSDTSYAGTFTVI